MDENINHKELETLRFEVGEADFKMLLHSFYEEADSRVKAIERHIADDNHNRLELDSHTLKSLARTFGAVTLGKSCAKLEAAAKNKDSSIYESQLGKIKSQSFTSLKTLREKYE